MNPRTCVMNHQLEIGIKHKSLSTSDLMSLFEAEKEALQYLIQLKNQTNNPSKLNQVIDRYLNLIDYDM